jgi:hypothetical protein
MRYVLRRSHIVQTDSIEKHQTLEAIIDYKELASLKYSHVVVSSVMATSKRARTLRQDLALVWHYAVNADRSV